MTPAAIVEFAEGLARIAASGGGAKALAAHLAETTGVGVLIEDREWRHLATVGAGSLPASARGLSNGRCRTFPIAAGQTPFGWLSIFAQPHDLDGLVHAARLTASAIAVELARDQGGGRGRRATFWERLVAHAYHDVNSAREDAIARGISLAKAYVCVALEPEVTDETHGPAMLADVRALAAESFPGGEAELGIIGRGAAVVVIVPASREVDAQNAKTAALLLPKTAAKRKSALRITGGVAGSVALLDVARGVEEAQAALTITRRVHGSGRIGALDDLGIYPLLYTGARVEALREFAALALAPLRAYDEKHQTELERTLRIYFDSGQNVKTAASELNVHRHTVFYRLRQIGEISGRSLESAHDQLTLRLAIAIDALHS